VRLEGTTDQLRRLGQTPFPPPLSFYPFFWPRIRDLLAKQPSPYLDAFPVKGIPPCPSGGHADQLEGRLLFPFSPFPLALIFRPMKTFEPPVGFAEWERFSRYCAPDVASRQLDGRADFVLCSSISLS